MLMRHPELSAAKRYLELVSKSTGLELSNIARRARLSTTTLTRPMNDPDHKGRITLATLRKVAQATGIPLPADLDPTPDAPAHDELDLALAFNQVLPVGRALSESEKRALIRELVGIVRRYG